MKPLVAATGAVNWDITIRVEKIPGPGEEARIESIEEVPGGKAANVAVAAARLLGKGGSAIISAVGEDEIGGKQKSIFAEEGVDTRALFTIKGSLSGRAYVLVEKSGENTILSFHGAAAMLRGEDADRVEVGSLLENLRILVAMDAPREFLESLIKRASERRVAVLLAPGLRAAENPSFVKRLAEKASYLVVNEHELGYLSGGGAKEAAAKLSSELGAVVVATLGARGALMAKGRDVFQVRGVDLAKMGLRVANTVGCGDAFIGAFASFKALGASDEKALRKANLAGAFKATKTETRGSPTLRELEEFEKRALEAGAFNG